MSIGVVDLGNFFGKICWRDMQEAEDPLPPMWPLGNTVAKMPLSMVDISMCVAVVGHQVTLSMVDMCITLAIHQAVNMLLM
jgi:hypothetical protein